MQMLAFIIRLYMLLITISRINEIPARHSSANTHDLASRVTSNHSRINENSTPCVGVTTHNSTPIVFPKPVSIKW
jgi:hypothetical protein